MSRALNIGFVPLTDSAPLIVAQEKGFFQKHGLEVNLQRVPSWAQIRDLLALGELDAAHMLAPMVPSSWLPGAYAGEKFCTALSLNLNGNAITVSNALYDAMVEADPDAMAERPVTARALRKVIAARIEAGDEPLTLGAVFPYSSHNYAVRYWLGAEGINPDRDVRMVVAPPPLMVEHLEAGKLDGFCVGEPWNSQAEYRGTGRAIVASKEIWRHFPEKVLGVRAGFAQEHRATHKALVMAVLEALAWLDQRPHRHEAAYLLSDPAYVGVSPTVLQPALTGEGVLRERKSLVEGDDFLIFHHYAANFPWRSHALWFLTQMVRWGQVDEPIDLKAIADQAYDPALYREAAEALGIAAPLIDHKSEGHRDRAWVLEDATSPIAMARSDFIDQGRFDPSNPVRSLEGYLRHNLRIAPHAF